MYHHLIPSNTIQYRERETEHEKNTYQLVYSRRAACINILYAGYPPPCRQAPVEYLQCLVLVASPGILGLMLLINKLMQLINQKTIDHNRR